MVDPTIVALITSVISKKVIEQLEQESSKEAIQRFLTRALLDKLMLSEISFTKGAAEFLAQKASERIVTLFSRKEERKDAAYEAVVELPKIEARLRKTAAAPRIDLEEIRSLRKSDAICGIIPWC